jgi:hypothetical protein
MKRAIFLVICGFIAFFIYDFFFASVIHPNVPFFVGEVIVIVIACSFVIAGIADGYPETRRYITRPQKAVYSAMDPSILCRVVKDGLEGAEYMVHGSGEITFREACTANWQFKYIDRKSNWIIINNNGNDVSNEPLSRFDGLFTLIGLNGTDESSDSADEFTSIHDSVEYYD